MNRLCELMEKENKTELEELEYDFLESTYELNGLIKTAKQLGNKNWQNNFMIKDALTRYEQAKAKYQKAIGGNV